MTILKPLVWTSILALLSVGVVAQQEAPDLVVQSIRFTPTFSKPDSVVQVTATVLNQGNRPVNDVFAIEFKINRVQIAVRFLSELASNEATDITVTWDSEPGEMIFRVAVDPFKSISELDETNNVLYKIVNVSPHEFTGADFVVRTLKTIPETVQAGQTARLIATIANIGQGSAPFVPVGFYVDGELITAQTLTEELPAGQEATIETPWTAEAGERVLRAKADPSGEITELDEANNTWSDYFEFAPASNSCTQVVSLEFSGVGISLLEEMTSLPTSDLLYAFIPAIRRQMERDYEGINVRFYLRQPTGIFGTIFFSQENRGPILGLAPLDFGNLRKDDKGFVFIGSFHINRGLRVAPSPLLAILFAKVSSHEFGHMLGLNHNPNGGIMNAQAETNPYLVTNEKFRLEDLDYLKRILPMDCGNH